MAQLFSRYESGLQFTAGAMAGSIAGTSGINPILDRLNSATDTNSAITGSLVSGTSTTIYTSGGNLGNAITNPSHVSGLTWIISGTNQIATGTSTISGPNLTIHAAVLNVPIATANNIGTPPTLSLFNQPIGGSAVAGAVQMVVNGSEDVFLNLKGNLTINSNGGTQQGDFEFIDLSGTGFASSTTRYQQFEWSTYTHGDAGGEYYHQYPLMTVYKIDTPSAGSHFYGVALYGDIGSGALCSTQLKAWKQPGVV